MNEKHILAAMKKSGLTDEEFGRLLATATNPINLDNATSREVRNDARVFIRSLPHGEELLDGEKCYIVLWDERKIIKVFGDAEDAEKYMKDKNEHYSIQEWEID